jgi:pimeloyl-ACP methyl ester carboxylesterase
MRNFLARGVVPLALVASAAFAQDGQPPAPAPVPPAAPKDAALAPKDVTLTTADGVKIAATAWPSGAAHGAGVVLLHMYGSDRTTWSSEASHLGARGITVLAIDLRGHGGSAKQAKQDLAPRVAKRDPKLFAEMHQDAWAAVQWLAKEGGCDPKRIALVGASVGCSVAIDTARRHPAEVAAVLCMSPGANYLGLDTLAHLKTFPAEASLLLLVHRTEVDAGAAKIAEARPGTRLVVYDDEAPADASDDKMWAHGTKMFGRLPLVERTVASFVAAKTGSTAEDVVLDGIVEEGADADPWARAADVAKPASDGTVHAFRVGRRMLFGGTAPAATAGLRFEVQFGSVQTDAPFPMTGPPQVVCVDLGNGKVAWSWGGMGSAPNLPGSEKLFGKTRPVLRVVRAGDRLTFEGEWTVPPMGDESASRMRLVVMFDRTLHEPPRGGMVEANVQDSAEVPAR